MPALPTRAQVPVAETWDLAAIYATPEDWEADAGHLAQDMEAVAAFRGRLGEGANVLLACLRARDALSDRLQRVAGYARLGAAADGLSPQTQALAARAGADQGGVRCRGILPSHRAGGPARWDRVGLSAR